MPLTIDNDGALPWWGLVWGLQSRYYDAAASAGLFFEAEGRTAMGGSTVVTGPAGASGGASNNVMRNTTLIPSLNAILSTQATGGGAHLSHVGTFRVFARVQTPTSNPNSPTTVALEWGEGDFRRFQQNRPREIPAMFEGAWLLVDLGLVSLRKVITGTQRWEGRIVAAGAGAIDIDWLMLVPADEGYGEVSAVTRIEAPSVVSVRDDFSGAGALNGQAVPSGGTWASSGPTGDWSVSGGVAFHTSTTSGRRVATAGASSFSDVVVQCDVSAGGNPALQSSVGVLARGTAFAAQITRISSTTGRLESALGANFLDNVTVPYEMGDMYTIRAHVSSDGYYAIWFGSAGSAFSGAPQLEGWHADLATGGASATGTTGICVTSPGDAGPRAHDAFRVWAPPKDAAVFAGRSLQVRHNSIRRQDSGGTMWVEPSSHPGDYLKVPPAALEGRTARFIIKPIYSPEAAPGVWPDPRTDAISARLAVTPRYLVVPAP